MKQFEEFDELADLVLEEIEFIESLDIRSEPEAHPVRRVYVRSVFASIDAISRIAMRMARKSLLLDMGIRLRDEGKVEIEDAVVTSLLNGEGFSIDREGIVKKDRIKMPFSGQVLFSVRMLAKAFGRDFDPKTIPN